MNSDDRPTKPFPGPDLKNYPAVSGRKRISPGEYRPRKPGKKPKPPISQKKFFTLIISIGVLSLMLGFGIGYSIFSKGKSNVDSAEKRLLKAEKLVQKGEYQEALKKVNQDRENRLKIRRAISERASNKALDYLAKQDLGKAAYFVKQARKYQNGKKAIQADRLLRRWQFQAKKQNIPGPQTTPLTQPNNYTQPSKPVQPQSSTVQTAPAPSVPKKEKKQPHQAKEQAVDPPPAEEPDSLLLD